MQAVGLDARGRKQYRYHPRYREVRDQAKFSRTIAFGAVLAIIRSRVKKDLERPGLPKEKVLATVVRLLETSFIRVGNDEYAKENESFGLTTMKDRHCAAGPCRNEREGKKALVTAVKRVAGRLGNRPATCRKYYVDPATLDSYLTGSLLSTLKQGERQQAAYSGLGLSAEEYCVMVTVAATRKSSPGKPTRRLREGRISAAGGPASRAITVLRPGRIQATALGQPCERECLPSESGSPF